MIVKGAGEDEGAENCPLCRLYAVVEEPEPKNWCNGCPVKEKTGMSSCNGTPYYDVGILHKPAEFITHADRQRAQVELEFLRSLLPDDVKGAVSDVQQPAITGE